VTIEPQLHVDAQAQLISLGKGFSGLPASLQSLNLFHISGDLIDGCRGIVEFSDLLKRPVDTFKYLLTACETGAVSVGPNILSLDTLWVGSANELQLDSFKEFPDFMSFKARMELIRVPYLLRVSEEAKVYEEDLEKISKEKPVAPHTAWVLGLWAVLTRLKRPNSINYPPALSSVISGLKPLEKAKLYDTGEVPPHLTPEEKKLLRVSLKRIREEYSSVPFYEGRMGASAREMKSVLYSAAQSSSTPHVSPLGILRELEEFCKRVSEYEFLKQDVKDGYHDAQEFIEVVRKEYLEIIDHEVRECMGLYESAQWEEYIRKYVQNISAHLKKEKIKNPLTGKLEDPDLSMMEEFEKIAGITSQDEARNGVIAQIGAWSLDHPKERVQYGVVFPEFWKALEKHYFESQKALLNKMHAALVDYGRDPSQETDPTDEGAKLARTTLDNMKSKLHYSESCAREALIFLMKTNYGS
jgi:predicted Ser/Thr protein kinase